MSKRITLKFDCYSDSGHGWAKVPMKLLHELGIANQISRYSYRRFFWAYLEEDRDLSLFVEAFEKRYGKVPEFRSHASSERPSRIRDYLSYYPEI